MRRPRGLLDERGELTRRPAAAEVRKLRGDALGAVVAAGLLALLVLVLVGVGLARRFGRALRVHQQAYRYIAPAMIGMIALVFFPFFYGISLCFTDVEHLQHRRPARRALGRASATTRTILFDFGIARRGADGALVSNYLNFYWTFLFTVIWTITNVTFGVTFGLPWRWCSTPRAWRFRPSTGCCSSCPGPCPTTSPRSSGRACSTGSSGSSTS